MENPDDEDDLKLVKASAGLLNDLQASLPELLWKRSQGDVHKKIVHRTVRRRDLEYVIKLIEPFQGEPQLLDASLKDLVPPLVGAYLDWLRLKATQKPTTDLDLEIAVCTVLYTLCKVRGYKVIVGFFNNEPRYLEPMLDRVGATIDTKIGDNVEWQVSYVLLLWLSHLMLTPFDLKSISPPRSAGDTNLLPTLAERAMKYGQHFLKSSNKAQEAAAMMLLRLVTRPDMALLRQANGSLLSSLWDDDLRTAPMTSIYCQLGSLRFLAGCTTSPELSDLIPEIYQHCRRISQDEESPIATNAVAKKMIIKTYRNVAITALRSSQTNEALLTLLTDTSMLEDVIDHLLQSLEDRDTPVRYAAAKALSRLLLEMEPVMGLQVIDAVLESFSEGMSGGAEASDFRNVDSLKWHGLTLTLAHILFKRSAAPGQLADIVKALLSALQFEQRTTTGSSIGTNVRDAANFGLWALSRRYTTAELLTVDPTTLSLLVTTASDSSIVQIIATQLVLAACLDPVGNIRRGASAALQELVGRHPNEVMEGISLVQIVDYQAVGLRRRAMIDVANRVASLLGTERIYWPALVQSMLDWRGIRSPDVLSRDSAATALAELSRLSDHALRQCLALAKAQFVTLLDAEARHGITLAMAYLLTEVHERFRDHGRHNGRLAMVSEDDARQLMGLVLSSTHCFDAPMLRSEQPVAVAKLVTALCHVAPHQLSQSSIERSGISQWASDVTMPLLSRSEEVIQLHIPPLVQALFALKDRAGDTLEAINVRSLSKQVAHCGTQAIVSGACRAIALGTLAPLYGRGFAGDNAELAITTLAQLVQAGNVDWRVIGIKALQLAVEPLGSEDNVREPVTKMIVDALHRGMNDYTIDERGDVGSLVRLQAILCTSCVLHKTSFSSYPQLEDILGANIFRLSLEKLDRVRMQAAQCRADHFGWPEPIEDVSSLAYFKVSLHSLVNNNKSGWRLRALLEGCISCAGAGSESVLQASRTALVLRLHSVSDERLLQLLPCYADIMKAMVTEGSINVHPALELLAFLLDMHIPQRLAEKAFKWKNLLSTVQKSHHKSNDISKILAAVHIYRGLADIPSIRGEVLKKLISMLKTNPYPLVRLNVADALFVVTGDEALKPLDWSRPSGVNASVVAGLQEKYVPT